MKSKLKTFVAPLACLCVLLLSQLAFAQRVVVLEFDGDKKDKLRDEVETALKKAAVVEVVPLKKYKDAAAKKKVKGGRAMTPAGVKAVARSLNLDAAVEGALGDTFFVRILDPGGNELWSKDLPLKGGLISADNAKRLAKAIAAAAAVGADSKAKAAPDEQAEGSGNEENTEEKTQPEEKEKKQPDVTVESDKPVVKEEKLPTVTITDENEGGSAEERKNRQREEQEESHTQTDSVRDTDLENEMKKPKGQTGPKLVQLQLLGSVTWRSYCARPGVSSCAQYDAMSPDQQPPGVTINFSAQFPYMGVQFGLELFPLAPLTDGPINGLGVVGYFGRGFALARVRSENDVAGTPPKEVIALDDSYFAGATYRYHFVMGDEKKPTVGYVGLRGGLMGRSFEVDPTANSPLPGSQRSYPMISADAMIPLIPAFKFVLAGQYYVNPHPGVDETAGFGQTSKGTGFGGEAGFAGDLFGPVGYLVKVRYAHYKDTYTGTGQRWTQVTQGAAEETYVTLVTGVTASF